MGWIESVHLRAYSQRERDEAIAVFHELTLMDSERGLGDIILLRDIAPDNDLCICIRWHGEVPGRARVRWDCNWPRRFPNSARSTIPRGRWRGRVPLEARRAHHEEPS